MERKKGLFLTIVIVLAVLIIAPILMVLYYTFFDGQKVDVGRFIELVMTKKMLTVFWQSIWLGFLVIIGTTIFALPLAFIMTKTSLRRYRSLDIIFTIPFMTPPYIGAMGWILFMQENGFLQQLLKKDHHITEWFFSLPGMVLIMSLHLYPFLYLMLKNALLRLQGSFQDATTIFGKGRLSNFWKVMLPLLLSSYALGSLLIFIKTLAEFGTPATFGKRIGYEVFTTEIHAQLSSWPIDIRMATSMSLVLLSTCLLVWYVQNTISRKFSYSTLSGKMPPLREKKQSFFVRMLSIGYVLCLIGISIGIPYFSILAVSLMKVRGNGLSLDNISFVHYQQLFQIGSKGYEAFMNSLLFSLTASVITIILGTMIALFVQKGQTKTAAMVDFMSLLPNTIPGIVIVVGLIMLWNHPALPVTIYNTKWMPIVTYVVLFLPYAVQYIKASYNQIDASIFQSARIFSPTKWSAIFNITLPLLLPGMFAAWMMTFIISMRELVGSLLVLPPSVQTVATFIYAQFEQGNVSLGMAMAVVTVLITIIVMLIVNQLQKGREHV